MRTVVVGVVCLVAGGVVALALFAEPLCKRGIKQKVGKLGGIVGGLLDGLDLLSAGDG